MKTFLFIAFGLFFAVLLPLSAKDFTWTGKGDGTSWNNPKNWDAKKGFPTKDDVAIFPDGKDAKITKGVPETLNRLIVKSGGKVSLLQETEMKVTGEGSSLPAVQTFINGKLITGKGFKLRAFSMNVADQTIENNGTIENGQ